MKHYNLRNWTCLCTFQWFLPQMQTVNKTIVTICSLRVTRVLPLCKYTEYQSTVWLSLPLSWILDLVWNSFVGSFWSQSLKWANIHHNATKNIQRPQYPKQIPVFLTLGRTPVTPANRHKKNLETNKTNKECVCVCEKVNQASRVNMDVTVFSLVLCCKYTASNFTGC